MSAETAIKRIEQFARGYEAEITELSDIENLLDAAEELVELYNALVKEVVDNSRLVS